MGRFQCFVFKFVADTKFQPWLLSISPAVQLDWDVREEVELHTKLINDIIDIVNLRRSSAAEPNLNPPIVHRGGNKNSFELLYDEAVADHIGLLRYMEIACDYNNQLKQKVQESAFPEKVHDTGL